MTAVTGGIIFSGQEIPYPYVPVGATALSLGIPLNYLIQTTIPNQQFTITLQTVDVNTNPGVLVNLPAVLKQFTTLTIFKIA